MSLDPTALRSALVILGAVLVVAVLAAALIVQVALRIGARQRLSRRIDSVLAGGGAAPVAPAAEAPPGPARRHTVQARLRALDREEGGRRKANALRAELLRSGRDWSVRRFALISLAAGLAGVGLSFLLGIRPLGSGWLAAVPIGLTMGVGAPRWTLRWMARRRIDRFTRQFADAVDVIIRGIRSGLPIEESLTIIARESPDPVGYEFRLVTEGRRLGLGYDEMLRRATERVPIAELKFFAIVLGLQRHTGGSLAETLQNLSTVLRERERLRGAVRAASSEARASAIIIGVLPFFVTGLMFVANSAYISLLFTDPLGQALVAFGAAFMATGVLIMRKMIHLEI